MKLKTGPRWDNRATGKMKYLSLREDTRYLLLWLMLCLAERGSLIGIINSLVPVFNEVKV